MHSRLCELSDLAGGSGLPEVGFDLTSASIDGADPVLPTSFEIGGAAAAALAAVGGAAAGLHVRRGGPTQSVRVETAAAAASLLSFVFQSIDGEAVARPGASYATVAQYAARDGRFIHLHGGFPGLRDIALEVLGCEDTPESLSAAVSAWDAWELEDALALAGGCGAVARSAEEWNAHPQGRWLATRPVVEIERIGDAPPELPRAGARPLERMRVLDLTRVLAGPTCARTLAAQGAEVIRISGPELPFIEPFVIDTGHGKRAAQLDLGSEEGRTALGELVRGADVFSQGYRSGSLARRGFGERELAILRPGIVAVSINCYGHGGPWHERPGWEQLAQTASGISMEQGGDGPPALLPAAATDYTTGYLAAFGALVALHRRATEGGSWAVRASLCQTARWLLEGGRVDPSDAPGPDPALLARHSVSQETPFGQVRHLDPIVEMSETPARWEQPTSPLGTHAPSWLEPGFGVL